MADDPKNTTTPEAVQKMVDEAIKKVREDAAVEVKKAKDEAAAAIATANGEITKINDERAGETRLAKAKTMIDGIPNVEPEALSAVMKGLDEAGLKTLTTIIDGAREAHKLAKTTGEIGAAGGGGAETTVQSRITKAAQLQKDKDPTLSHAKAVTKALEADPQLYADYRAQR